MRLDTNVNFAEYRPLFNVTLSEQHKDIVDRAMALDTAIKRGMNPTRLGEALSGLKFSEKTCIYGEKVGLQFADDVATPAIGNWTFGSLNMLIQEVGSSMEKDTLLSLAFPDKSVPMYKVLLDRIAANTGVLPEFGGDSATLPTIRQLDTYGLTYEPGLWAGRTMLTAKDIDFARKRGIASFDQRGFGQLVAYNSVQGVVQGFTRKNLLLNDAVFSNGFTYSGATITSNIPGGNFLALDPMGTLESDGSVTYSNPDPLYNPLIAITNVVNNPALIKYHSYIRGIVMNDADLQAILNHPNVKPTTNAWTMGTYRGIGRGQMGGIMEAIKDDIGTYYAPSFQFPLLSDRETWQQQNLDGTASTTNNYFIPRGKMFVLMDLTSFGGQLGAFHLTYNEVDPNVESPAMGLFTGVFNRNLENSDTVNRLDIVTALSGAPAIYMPEACFVLTSFYSNI